MVESLHVKGELMTLLLPGSLGTCNGLGSRKKRHKLKVRRRKLTKTLLPSS